MMKMKFFSSRLAKKESTVLLTMMSKKMNLNSNQQTNQKSRHNRSLDPTSKSFASRFSRDTNAKLMEKPSAR